MCQAVSTGYVAITAKVGRSSAVGLYVTSFYIGGSFGAAVGGVAWTLGGWPACVALVVAMLVVMAAIVIFGWARRVPAAPTAADRTAVTIDDRLPPQPLASRASRRGLFRAQFLPQQRRRQPMY